MKTGSLSDVSVSLIILFQMVLSRVLVQLQRLRQFHHENAKDHRRLIKVLDCMQLDTLKVTPTQSPSKIAVELESFEQLATLASHFYERDQVLKTSIDRTLQVFHGLRPGQLKRLKEQLKTVKKELGEIREKLVREGDYMQRVGRRVEMVVGEFRVRCREAYTEYLKCLDLDLRRVLKPLVPSSVLDEEIRYKHINGSVPSSLRSSLKSELRDPPVAEPSDPQAQTQNHTELLVNTLETVARELIGVCCEANRRYYEIVDPKELISGPPTPLAAQLPEYFSFKAANYQEDQLDLLNLVDPAIISETQRGILMEKLVKLGRDSKLGSKLLEPAQVQKLKLTLESLARKQVDFRDLSLSAILRDESLLSSTGREKLVFSLINSDRPHSQHVTLEEMMKAGREDSSAEFAVLPNRETRTPSVRKQARTPDRPTTPTRSEIVEAPTLIDVSFEGNLQLETPLSKPNYRGDFYTPQGGEDIKRGQSFFKKHRQALPPISKPEPEKNPRPARGGPALRRSEPKEIRVHSVTPGPVRRSKEERKVAKKSSRSPVPHKAKTYLKKHSLS